MGRGWNPVRKDNGEIEKIRGAMELTFNLGDKVILDGLKGYWEIVDIESVADSAKRYTLRIKANHKYDCIDCVEFFCCEKTLARIAANFIHNPFLQPA